jgi:hypothetical protein
VPFLDSLSITLVDITIFGVQGSIRRLCDSFFRPTSTVRINVVHQALPSKNSQVVKTRSGMTSGLEICHHHRRPRNMDPQSKLRPSCLINHNPFFHVLGNAENHPCSFETTLPPTPLPRAMTGSLVPEDARKSRTRWDLSWLGMKLPTVYRRNV